jgi:hypothetical protein
VLLFDKLGIGALSSMFFIEDFVLTQEAAINSILIKRVLFHLLRYVWGI